jgi:hypothetical protein
MNHINIIPTGGLCNRMRAIASGIFLAKSLNLPTTIYWNNCHGLKANFGDLFKPIAHKDIDIIENKSWKYNIKGKKDYYLRWFLLHHKNNVIFNCNQLIGDNIFQKINSCKHNELILISCYPMCNMEKINNLFIPTDEITEKINNITSEFSSHTIGIHIRRTDNLDAIKNSPTELFINIMENEIKKDYHTNFYLATDDSEIKNEIKDKFKNRIITYNKMVDRDSLEGMKDAVVELYALSKTKKIIGSYASSFSQTAALIGNTEYYQAKK